MRPSPEPRAAYRWFADVPTRWMDNDVYGHVNNVVYYAYFDTIINRFLIAEGGLDIHGGAVIGLCVESHCAFLEAVAFPSDLEAGMRVAHLGNSSVRYEVGIFRNDDPMTAAKGHFIHVYVNRATRRPAPLPAPLRQALERLVPAA